MEGLPGEIVIEIFNFLTLRERFDGFWNLNTQLNELLIHCQYHLSLKNDDENSKYICENLLHSQLILHLRLENLRKINRFPAIHFSNLIALTICKCHLTDSILDLIRSSTPTLQSLNLSSFISKKWNEILPLILSLPKLHTCHLYLGMALCAISSSNLVSLSLKHLYLINSRQPCALHQLSPLLNRLPNLNSLHIRCQRLLSVENPSLHQSSVVNLTLITNCLPELFGDFMSAVFSLMPSLKQLKLQSIQPVPNLVYLNIYQWKKFLDLCIHLEKLTLILHPKSTIKNSFWTNRCQQLRTLTNTRQIEIQIQDS